MPRCIDCNSLVITGSVMCGDCLKNFEQYSKLRTGKVNVRRMIEIFENYGAERISDETSLTFIDSEGIRKDLLEISLNDLLHIITKNF